MMIRPYTDLQEKRKFGAETKGAYERVRERGIRYYLFCWGNGAEGTVNLRLICVCLSTFLGCGSGWGVDCGLVRVCVFLLSNSVLDNPGRTLLWIIIFPD